MRKKILNGLGFFVIFVLSMGIYHCNNSPPPSGGGGGQPALTAADFPSVSPCSDRDTLPTDQTFKDTIAAATTVLPIHRKYDGDTTLPAVCGLEGSWDPSAISDAAGTEQRSDNIFDPTVADFIEVHFLGISMTQICRTGFHFADPPVDTALGFLAAGTYRGEGCVESGGNAYRVRVRVTVSGPGADKKFGDFSPPIASAADLAIYNSSGTPVVTQADAKATTTGSPDSFTFTVRSADGLTTYLTVTVEVICVKKLTTACPAEN